MNLIRKLKDNLLPQFLIMSYSSKKPSKIVQIIMLTHKKIIADKDKGKQPF